MKFPYRYAPGAEAIGQAVLSLVNHINHEEVRASLQEHGLWNIDPQKWYPVDDLLAVFAAWLQGQPGTALTNLISIGVATVNNIILPADANELPYRQLLLMLNEVYHAQHRHGDIGDIVCEAVDDKGIRYTSTSVYPDYLIYGYVYGMARRFLPENTHFVVKFDDNTPRQDEGGKRTILHLSWT